MTGRVETWRTLDFCRGWARTGSVQVAVLSGMVLRRSLLVGFWGETDKMREMYEVCSYRVNGVQGRTSSQIVY